MSDNISSNNVLKVENATMQFGGVVAVNNLSLEVNKNEIIALIGPNGAGKTTAFNCITGVYEPTNGAVYLDGKPLVMNHPQGKMKAQYAGENKDLYNKTIIKTPDEITALGVARTFQNIRLFSSLSVFENILIAQHLNIKSNMIAAAFLSGASFWDKKAKIPLARAEELAMRKRADELLEEFSLTKYKYDKAGSLPYGIQRKLEIARALATNPNLLLLDEPAAGMNPQETLELTDFIFEIKNRYGISIFMIEHHMDLVMQISDRIYVLDFGKKIAEGTPLEIQKNQRVIDAYLGVDEEDA